MQNPFFELFMMFISHKQKHQSSLLIRSCSSEHSCKNLRSEHQPHSIHKNDWVLTMWHHKVRNSPYQKATVLPHTHIFSAELAVKNKMLLFSMHNTYIYLCKTLNVEQKPVEIRDSIEENEQ